MLVLVLVEDRKVHKKVLFFFACVTAVEDVCCDLFAEIIMDVNIISAAFLSFLSCVVCVLVTIIDFVVFLLRSPASLSLSLSLCTGQTDWR